MNYSCRTMCWIVVQQTAINLQSVKKTMCTLSLVEFQFNIPDFQLNELHFVAVNDLLTLKLYWLVEPKSLCISNSKWVTTFHSYKSVSFTYFRDIILENMFNKEVLDANKWNKHQIFFDLGLGLRLVKTRWGTAAVKIPLNAFHGYKLSVCLNCNSRRKNS